MTNRFEAGPIDMRSGKDSMGSRLVVNGPDAPITDFKYIYNLRVHHGRGYGDEDPKILETPIMREPLIPFKQVGRKVFGGGTSPEALRRAKKREKLLKNKKK